MKLKPLDQNLNIYLKSSSVIDWNNPEIVALAQQIAGKNCSDTTIAKLSFEWVRDNIKHSNDFKLNPVTCTASEVLKYKRG